MVGTVLIGVAITIGNIAVPLIIRRDFAPRRQATAMGVYTAALNIGSFLTSVITAPLADLLGWRLSLAASACWRWLRSCFGFLPLVSAAPWFRRPCPLLRRRVPDGWPASDG